MSDNTETPIPLDVYETAAALGGPLPAPFGAETVVVRVTEYVEFDEQLLFFGVYATMDDGYADLARWCVTQLTWLTWREGDPIAELSENELAAIERLRANGWEAGDSPRPIIAEYTETTGYSVVVQRQIVKTILPWGEGIEKTPEHRVSQRS